ncbi:hypothetical protein HBA_0476 [Sodalis endosymbiont of Henestaris halophilus]|nr:hypothetical protein HBA_0476 [Sodalis endosymbiont of Henestaris halophilus]
MLLVTNYYLCLTDSSSKSGLDELIYSYYTIAFDKVH